MEEEVGKVLMGRPPPPVMHNKSDLEKDIEGLKVSCNGWYTTTLQRIVLEYIVLRLSNTDIIAWKGF